MYTTPKKDPRSIMGTDRRPNPLRYVNLKEWDDGAYGDISFQESQPDTLEEPWPYRFQSGDSVWIHSTGYDWYQGKISGLPKAAQTKMGDGLFWPVTYNRNKRRYAAPLNGELKPDTPPIRKMLEEAGIL
ncbi:uncharacterized protein F5891DRAFT_994423 [Suillus fuscotomentosus]|uniref:Uncharacterized protein n=1 Tax=Suillus fuscotomentosus TaxID=1912939 RepID=A0AAD4HWC7_9AGAM|nr:uncharacterized protein F5891DRAFT_994423 [Suillus fuscotomentosus]KAG1908684.1 hypothetical protein F5891DRAFT_994423 [Suillus fuscotomentosus]